MFGDRHRGLVQDDAPPSPVHINPAVHSPGPMRPFSGIGVGTNDTVPWQYSNDGLIRRDFTPWYPRATVNPAGKGFASWWAAGPARPELAQRNVTVNRAAGTSRTRFLQNPLAPGTGLHSQSPEKAGTVARYTDTRVGKMSTARQNRLSPARYDGQSYSQTTLTQGARR